MHRLLVSAARKSSGKTTIAAGLCAALRRRGWRVHPFKKGPDYIDPMWLSRAAGRPCINLDFHTMTDAEIRARLGAVRAGEMGIIEGNKGLFDGLDVGGADSNAALAKALGAPVLLVLDARGMTRGVAPLLLGYRAFDPRLDMAGVILNNTGGARHEAKLRAAIERYTDIEVLGAVRFDATLNIAERHLGLVTCDETAAGVIDALADALAAQVDLDAVEAIAARAPGTAPAAGRPNAPLPRQRESGDFPFPRPPKPQKALDAGSSPVWGDGAPPAAEVTVAVARDAAFTFYYADDLAAFADHGARLVPFDTLKDAALPGADALYIGGGFPETHAAQLAGNRAMRAAVKRFVERGGPVYAECGGLMYLARSLTWGGQTWDMAGALPARIYMSERPVGRGYVVLRETGHAPWPAGGAGNGRDIPAHEFHYSRLQLPADARLKFAYRVQRGHGINGRFDGLVHANVLANYSHFRNTAANPWIARFISFVRAHKAGVGRAV
ncbi:MAG: cobyrinate a,c-diamide synthase [Gammaproteobacteria bacterium]|nr:cobyrinate a,c-diamide synthase [Gammaproteobacteria bacterium]